MSLYISCFCFLTYGLTAQDWPPVGTKWYYGQHFQFYISLTTVEVVEEVMFNDQLVKRLEINGGSCAVTNRAV